MSAAFQLLTHRLEWPVTRVRYEAAYQLATAISEGDRAASDALLAWLAGRQLESEAVVGVSIIDAFNLGPHFDAKAVVAAVQAPSYLSDLLILRNFPSAGNLFPFRYEYARGTGNGTIDPDHRAYFDRHLGQTIALRYQTRLARLEQKSGLPFLERWFEEWAWLQHTLDAPFSGRPDYIWAGGPRENVSNVQVRQTELYISAYLRTLAFAVAEWRMPADVANHAALEALPFNRGMAGVRPATRPTWTFDTLKRRAKIGLHTAAMETWAKAERSVEVGQKLLALQTTDHGETEFLALSFRRVLSSAGSISTGPGEAFEQLPWAFVEDEFGGMAGPLVAADGQDSEDERFLSAYVQPARFPRFLLDLFPTGVELGHPRLFEDAVEVSADDGGLTLMAGSQPMSRWIHWFADWQPTHPRELHRLGGGLTTIKSSVLASAIRRCGTPSLIYCKATYGFRKYSYDEAKIEQQTFWL